MAHQLSMQTTTKIIDGFGIARRARALIAQACSGSSPQPGLGVILVGDDPASEVYVRNKLKACQEVGFHSAEIRLPASASQQQLHAAIEQFNQDDAIHGFLLQLPLPAHLDKRAALELIAPGKDVDGLGSRSFGKLFLGLPGFVPCTPLGSMLLLYSCRLELKAKSALVIGRSDIVGKPIAKLLLDSNCTPTLAHSASRDLPGLCAQADIVVAAVGQPRAISGAWLRPGSVVIDVGINRVGDKLVGDVDYDGAVGRVGAITPVPRGVGPMTIAMLLYNTYTASNAQAPLGAAPAYEFFASVGAEG